MTQVSPWPVEIRLSKGKNRLTIRYDNGEERVYSAAVLRRHSPSAEVKGHGGKPPPAAPVSDHITITAIEPVGNYAVRLTFDDGHDTGLYSWDYLYKLEKTQAA